MKFMKQHLLRKIGKTIKREINIKDLLERINDEMYYIQYYVLSAPEEMTQEDYQRAKDSINEIYKIINEH